MKPNLRTTRTTRTPSASKVFALVLCAALVLSSCEGFFSTNLFTKLLPPKDYTSLSSAELRGEAYTSEGQLAATFIAELKADPSARTAVLTTLEYTMSSSSSSSSSAAEKQEALALYVDIQLATTDAGTVVNNVVAAITAGLPDFANSSDPAEDAVAFVKSLLPAALLTDETAFKSMITALTTVDKKVNAVVESSVEGTYNVGNLAQAALVAALVAGVQPSNSSTGETAIADALWDAINDTTGAISGITPPVFDDTFDTSLELLLAAAGIDTSALNSNS